MRRLWSCWGDFQSARGANKIAVLVGRAAGWKVDPKTRTQGTFIKKVLTKDIVPLATLQLQDGEFVAHVFAWYFERYFRNIRRDAATARNKQTRKPKSPTINYGHSVDAMKDPAKLNPATTQPTPDPSPHNPRAPSPLDDHNDHEHDDAEENDVDDHAYYILLMVHRP